MTAIPVRLLRKEVFPFLERTNISASEMYFYFPCDKAEHWNLSCLGESRALQPVIHMADYLITHDTYVRKNREQTAQILSDYTEVMERSPTDNVDYLLAVRNLLLCSAPAPCAQYS